MSSPRRLDKRKRFEALVPFVEGSEVSMPSLRRRMVCVALEGVAKKPPPAELVERPVSKKRARWVSGGLLVC